MLILYNPHDFTFNGKAIDRNLSTVAETSKRPLQRNPTFRVYRAVLQVKEFQFGKFGIHMYLAKCSVTYRNKHNRTRLSAIARTAKWIPVALLAVLDLTNTIKHNIFRMSPTGMITNWLYSAIVAGNELCSRMGSEVEFRKKVPALEFVTKLLLTPRNLV